MATCEARKEPAAPPPRPANQPGLSLLNQKQNEKREREREKKP